MTFRTLLLTGSAVVLMAGCGADVQVVEDMPRAPETQQAFTLDYESFTLDNGLEVILQRDTSDPIVAVSTVIHAGSARERPGRTGFAHFFEHMAFNDSENVPRGWNRGQIPKWGGARNGGTWSDGTIYYEVVPKDAFEKILWIDSDRLGYMINTVTEAALEREKQVVKNEKRQRVDNVAYGYTNEIIRAALYPEDHPYHWTTIGSLPDLQAATLDDVREFYDDWYGPNNATLAIVGDIDIAETRRLVELWFGEIPRGRDIPDPEPMPVSLDETKNLYFEDSFATLPELRMTFPTVHAEHEDAMALTMLGAMLGGSRNSPLYVEIVENTELAPSVSAFHSPSELAGTFTIRIRGKEGVDLDAVKSSVEAALADFAENGVDPLDLQRVKAEQETSLYGGLSTALGKANSFAQNNELYGDPAYSVTRADLIRAVTAEQIESAFATYIHDQPFILTSFVPQGQTELAVEGAELAEVWIEEVRDDVASEAVSAGEIAVYERTVTEHDRSEPPFGELPLISMPEVWTRTLDYGVVIRGIEADEIPLVQFDVTIPGGRYLESATQNGRLALLADLMNEGTANRSPAEFEQAVGLLGSGISVSAGSETLTISGTALTRNFEETVALVEEVLTEPRWEEADFERVRSARLTSITGREANANAIAAQVYSRLLYGEDHPLGRPSGGSAESVAALTLSDLQSAHAKLLTGTGRMHIVGDIDPDRAVAGLEVIADEFESESLDIPSYTIPEQSSAGRVFFVDVPDAKQSVLRIGRLIPDGSHPDYNRLRFTNEKLGGGIAGDLAQTLRIEKGFTYGAVSRVPRGTVEQPFTISTSVRANATQASLETIRDMVRAYPETLDAAASETMQQKLIKSATRAFESLGAKLGTLRQISQFGLSDTYVEDEQAELLAMTPDDFQDTARTYLTEDQFIYVVVGDAATQLESVQAFAAETGKGEVVQLDIFGDPND